MSAFTASTPDEATEATLAQRFHYLFNGSEKAHGITELGEVSATGKREAKSFTGHSPLTVQGCIAHLAGQKSVGSIPLRGDGTCSWGAIDIDLYENLDYAELVRKIWDSGSIPGCRLPVILCKSKSGGAHLFLFASEPVPAALMMERLTQIAVRLGYKAALLNRNGITVYNRDSSNVEIFPKQSAGEIGNFINLPYCGEDRHSVDGQGNDVPLTEFLAMAESVRETRTWFEQALPNQPRVNLRQYDSAAKHRKMKPFLVPTEIPEGQRNDALASIAGKLRHSGFSPDEILTTLRASNEKRCNPSLPDIEVQSIVKSIGHKEPATQDQDVGITKELAATITDTAFFARDQGGRLYHWDSGAYRPTGQRFIERRVKELCVEWGKTKSWSPELATRVEQWILVDAPELWECPPLDTLSCRNGLLDVETRTLRDHSPDYLSPVQIAASFNPDAECPEISKFIRDVFPDDAQRLAFEIVAWLMLPDVSLQKSVLLLGEGANGKSAWLALLETFLGREHVSTLSLHRIEGDKFAAARLVGKLCNIGTDLPTAALSGTSMFKALTGGDTITAERKFESSFEFRPFARLLFSANVAPRSEDSTHGFFRRWLVVPFNRTFDESDSDTVTRSVLDARLSDPAELSGLLNRALDALPVIRQGRFTESASTRAALEEFRTTTDPFAVWLDQATVERPGAQTLKDQIRNAYAQVCQDAGRPIMRDTQFTAALKRLRPKVRPSKRRVDGKLKPVYLGLGLLTQEQVPGGVF